MNTHAENLAKEWLEEQNKIPRSFGVAYYPSFIEAFIAGRKSASAWVKCSDALPPLKEDVLGYDGCSIFLGRVENINGSNWDTEEHSVNGITIYVEDIGPHKFTHWQLLPSAPVSLAGMKE